MRPLVFVHGFMGGGAQWRDQVAAFSVGRDVLTPDLPGFGGRADLPAPRTIADFARAMLDDVKAAGIEQFDLVGHSIGGMIVQEMAARTPERIVRLVLYGTAPSGNLPDRFESFETSRKRARDDGAEATARRISATWFLDREAAPGYRACADIAAQAGLPAILAGLDAMEGWHGLGSLAPLSMPTLVLWGDCDRTYSWSQTEALWRRLPSASLSVIPGCAHAVHMEKPALFNAVVEDFLNR